MLNIYKNCCLSISGLPFQNTRTKYYSMTSIIKPFIVGISGVTNGGKTTLTKRLQTSINNPTYLLKQDDYFYPEDSPFHIPCPAGIPHLNWDVISSLDMNRMVNDVMAAIDKYSIYIKEGKDIQNICRTIILLDGFLLFDDARITDLCDVKLFLTIPKEICQERRSKRSYEPPDPPGYFEFCVWPMYLEHSQRIENIPDILFMDGDQDFDNIISIVEAKINAHQ